MNKLCPACRREKMTFIADHPMRDFDDSIFNGTSKIYECSFCHFVKFSPPFTTQDLNKYYENDVLNHILSGIGTGNLTENDLTRYTFYFEILQSYLKKGDKILDVGCSGGGFLSFIKSKSSDFLAHGVDYDKKQISKCKELDLDVAFGGAESIPLADSSVDVMTCFHVLEHILDLNEAVKEISRVLKDDGYLLIEVPDKEHYDHLQYSSDPMFWMTIKEHVNHFSTCSFYHLFSRHNLSLKAIFRHALPNANGKYPSLIILAEKNRSKHCFKNYFNVYKKMHQERSDQFYEKIKHYKNIIFWGIGFEFFDFYAHIDKEKLNDKNTYFIDKNQGKQSLTIDQKNILNINAISPDETSLLVVCVPHLEDLIIKEAKDFGWCDDQIFCLKTN